MNNQDRAESAYKAVERFSDELGMADEDDETIMSDLLCNMMHFCDQQGVDFQDCLDRASRNYEVEFDS